MAKKKIILAFSGGLDTSAIVPWLIDTYGAEIIAYCSDLGNAPDAARIEKRAASLGASRFIFEDVQDRFAEEFVFPMIRAGAVYQDEYLLGTAIARPLIAERIAHWAKELGAVMIVHGGTGKGNDQLRFERAWARLVPEIEILAPWKTWDFKGRSDLQAYLISKGFEVSTEEKEFSVDVNLLHRSCEGGILESIDRPFPIERVADWCKPTVGQASRVSIAFDKGIPVAIDGKKLGPAELLKRLNALGSKHGIGIVDIVEDRTNGIKSRGVYETPGGTILHKAVRCLKQVAWNRSMQDAARSMADHYATLVYDGVWHSDAREAVEAFFEKASDTLSGTIELELVGQQMYVRSRSCDHSLYDAALVSFEQDVYGINAAAKGYSKTLCLSQWQSGMAHARARAERS